MSEPSSMGILKEKERFEAFFEYATMGILVADSKGKIEMVNNFLLSQFGFESKSELVGQPVEVLIPSRYETNHHQYRNEYNKNPGRRAMGIGRDLFGKKKDGSEFPVEISLSNYSLPEGNFIIAFIIDITIRKETERALMLQKEQLAANNLEIEELNSDLEKKVELRTSQLKKAMIQIEASRDELKKALNKEKELGDLKSRFVSMASHEFRTPLSTILSSASLLAKYTETGEQEKRDKHIDRIKSSVNNLIDILNEFLSIGKIEDGRIMTRFTRFNVKDFISNICSEMKSIAKKGQVISFEHSGPEIIELDETLLKNIILNMVSNAIKFSTDDGKIEVISQVENGRFCITVKDNGIGISEEDQQHLFERFFRGSNATNIQGTGLGLHIVSKYAELMDGIISFESELEKGTSIKIAFKHTV